MIIVLLGYMGCGKSSVGKQLAKDNGAEFLDLDAYIENLQNQSITELFDSIGEIQFRALERRALEEVCRTNDRLVLSLGGGTPCYGDTMSFLVNHPNVFTIYLKSSVQTLVDRLKHEKSKRPLLAHLKQDQMPEFIAKHIFERSKFYSQAQLTLNVDQKSVDEIVSEINSELH